MKTIVIYYSLSGNTKSIAEKTAKEQNAEIYEVKTLKKAGLVKSFFQVPKALRQKEAKIQPLAINLSNYDKIIVMTPVWASALAPAANNVFNALPSGKSVEVWAVSSSGNSGAKDKAKRFIESKGCKMIEYRDIKAADLRA